MFDTVHDATALTPDALSSFLLPEGVNRKEKLRQTMLRFHPDKFEGRILRHVRETDKELVRDAVGRITRAINDLLVDKHP